MRKMMCGRATYKDYPLLITLIASLAIMWQSLFALGYFVHWRAGFGTSG